MNKNIYASVVAISSAVILATGSFFLTRALTISSPVQQNTGEFVHSTDSSKSSSSSETKHLRERAIAVLSKLQDSLDANPQNKVLTLQLANLYYDVQMYPNAQQLYKKYLDAFNPKDTSVMIDYGYALFKSGNQTGGIEATKKVLLLNSKHPIAIFNIAVMYYEQNNVEETVRWLKKCVEVAPTSDVGKKSKEFLETLSKTLS